MPVTVEGATINYSVESVLLRLSGTADIVVRKTVSVPGNGDIVLQSDEYHLDSSVMSAMLDHAPVNGLTRRQDIGLALYQYCISQGWIPDGEIT